MLSPDDLLERLKANAHPRTCKSLDKLHQILSDYFDSRGKDWCLTTIGRISTAAGGPRYPSLRATCNQHYRDLIAAWAEKAGTTMKKPLLAKEKNYFPTDEELLKKIPDVALRSVFGQILAERARLRREVLLLKQETEIIVDMRPGKAPPREQNGHSKDQAALAGVISEAELEALKFAVSQECLDRNGWKVNSRTGQVKNVEYKHEVLPRGFITGLGKLLDAIAQS